MQNTLKEMIERVLDSCDNHRSHFRPTSDMVLDCATRIFISQNISNERNINKKILQDSQDNIPKLELPKMLATDKQKYALKNIGIDFNSETITKQEAFNLIKKAKE